MKRILFLIFIFAALTGSNFGQRKPPTFVKNTKNSKKKFVTPTNVFPSKGYSQAISVSGGRTIYIAGQIALDEKGELIGKDDIRAQTQQVFENIKRILAASGATFADVVKLSYFVKNFKPEILPAIRETRDRFLPKNQPPPTSTLVGVQSLFRDDILIEIECIAVIEK